MADRKANSTSSEKQTRKPESAPKPEPKPAAKPAADLPPELSAEGAALLGEAAAAGPAAPGAPVPGAPPPDPQTAEMLRDMLGITFNGLIAPRRGDHWKLAPDECEQLGKAYGAVLDKYFPSLDMGVEFTAIVVTFTAFGPRIAQDVALARAAEEAGEGAQGEGAGASEREPDAANRPEPEAPAGKATTATGATAGGGGA